MTKIITAVEHDGLDIRTITGSFKVPSEDFDIIAAIKAASNEYIHTEEGKQTLDHNCGQFNFADFVNDVPRRICVKHGFEFDREIDNILINWDEQLIDDPDNEYDE